MPRLDIEMEMLRKDLGRFQIELRHRLEIINCQVRKYISQTYNNAILDYLDRASERFMATLNCMRGTEAEMKCKEEIKNIKKKYFAFLRSRDLKSSLETLGEALDLSVKAEKNLGEQGLENCVDCMKKEVEFMEVNEGLLKQIYQWEGNEEPSHNDKSSIAGIDPNIIQKDLLIPVAHKSRLQVLLSIFKGANRFHDFIRSTGVSGGHLIYHLNKLSQSGFIEQYETKDYVLTRKGLRTLTLLSLMLDETIPFDSVNSNKIGEKI